MTTPPPVRSAPPARLPGEADAAALTLVLSHADVAALRRQLAQLIAPEPSGEADGTRDPPEAGTPKALPGSTAR